MNQYINNKWRHTFLFFCMTVLALFTNGLHASCRDKDSSCSQDCATADGSCMNRVVHFEIHADNPERAAKFYTTVFGWNIFKWDNPTIDYWLVTTGPEKNSYGINGGIMRRIGPKPAGQEAIASYVCTIAVCSLEETMEKVRNAGGKIVVPKMNIPTVGWLAYCTDTEGNQFGIMETDPEAC